MSFRRQVFAAFQPLVDIALFILVNTALFFAARLALLYFLLPDITERGHIPHFLCIDFHKAVVKERRGGRDDGIG